MVTETLCVPVYPLKNILFRKRFLRCEGEFKLNKDSDIKKAGKTSLFLIL